MRFSPSRLKTWGKCQQQAKFAYIDKIPQKQNAAASYGSAVHLALELYNLTGDMEAAIRTFLYAWDRPEEFGIKPDIWPPRTNFSSYRERGVAVLREYEEIHKWTDREFIASELNFCVKFRDHEFTGIVDSLEYDPQTDTVVIRDYKGLALDTKIPTPTGWSDIGSLRVGDKVFGSDGRPCGVVGKSAIRNRKCFEIVFDDKTRVIADDEHLWKVYVGNDPEPKILSSLDLVENLVNPKTNQKHLKIVNANAIECDEVDLIIDPYILGLWLGDGTSKSSEITATTEDAVFYGSHLAQGSLRLGTPRTYSTATVPVWTIHGLRSGLVAENLLCNKHVPRKYMRASSSQRLDLLRGLMDSDGSWNNLRSQAVFVNTNEALADAVYELVVSLGWRANKWSGRSSGPNGFIGTQHRVSFTPFGLNPFKLPRKASLFEDRGSTISRRRLIVEVNEVDSVPTQCISVDSIDNTYLCTESMVVTHNTGFRPNGDNLRMDIQFSIYMYASTQPEFWMGNDTNIDRYKGVPDGALLYDKYMDSERSGIWYDLRNNKEYNVGPRTIRDYDRLELLCNSVERAYEKEVFVPSISGDTCRICSYQDICPAYIKEEE